MHADAVDLDGLKTDDLLSGPAAIAMIAAVAASSSLGIPLGGVDTLQPDVGPRPRRPCRRPMTLAGPLTNNPDAAAGKMSPAAMAIAITGLIFLIDTLP